MDSPWIFAIGAFLAVYLLFFIISLLADIYIVGIALVTAFFSYNVPRLYPELQSTLNDFGFLSKLGMSLSTTPTATDYYIIIGLAVLAAVFVCIPVLPFSATYRQMLGANRLSKHEEGCVKRLVHEELVELQVETVNEESEEDTMEDAKKIAAEKEQAMSLIIESEKKEHDASKNSEDSAQHPRNPNPS